MADTIDTDANDAQAQADEAKARRRAQRDADDLRWVLQCAQGRRFVARLLDRAGVHRSSFTQSGSQMAFNEGRRDIGLFLTAEILEHAPKSYLQLLNEYRNDH